MSRLPHLTFCLVGALLLMPLCRAEKELKKSSEEYDTTPDYDYIPTFDYTFYSNSSDDDLEKFLKEAGGTEDVELGTGVTPTEEVTEGELEPVDEEDAEEEVTITKPPILRNAPTDEAWRTTSPCLVIILSLLISHQLARLL